MKEVVPYKERRRRRIAEVFPDADEDALHSLAEELGVAYRSVRALAAKYGIRRSEAFVRARRAMRAEGMRSRATRYGPEFVERLREYYPTHTNEECAEHFSMSQGSVFQLARRHGIRKTAGHRSAVNGRNSRKRHG